MKVDLSSSAITRRLKQTSALRRLCLSLGGQRLREKIQKGVKTEGNPQAKPTHLSLLSQTESF